MKFSDMIEKIMTDVESGSKEPFIIFRDEYGDWRCDYTQNQYSETLDWVESVKKQDLFAITFTGEDFAHGSFPNIYDRILNERLRAEYESAPFHEADLDELKAMVCLLEENIGEFSYEVTDYLTMFDRPLATLYEMTPVSVKSDDPGFDYNPDKTHDFIQTVEIVVNDRLYNRKKQEIPKGLEGAEQPEKSDNKPNKRNIGGYEEKLSIQLAGKHVIFAENPAEAAPYLVCCVKSDNVLNLEEHYNDEVFADYVEAMRGFTNQLDDLVSELETERSAFGLVANPLTAAECMPNSAEMNWEGKLVVIKADILAPEYRSAEHQLALCIGGFGASPDASGRAVYVEELHSGKKCRYDRHQIAGIADPERLPQWAVSKLNEKKLPEQTEPKPVKKPTLHEKLNNAKEKVREVDAAKPDKGDKPKTKRDERE